MEFGEENKQRQCMKSAHKQAKKLCKTSIGRYCGRVKNFRIRMSQEWILKGVINHSLTLERSRGSWNRAWRMNKVSHKLWPY